MQLLIIFLIEALIISTDQSNLLEKKLFQIWTEIHHCARDTGEISVQRAFRHTYALYCAGSVALCDWSSGGYLLSDSVRPR